MQKFTLNKTIAAKRLNKAGVPLAEPDATIPFGAVIDGVERDGSHAIFRYLMESYRCPYEVLISAADDVAAAPPGPQPSPSSSAPNVDAGPSIQFERVTSNVGKMHRAKVPGGWLIALDPGGAVFYPDPEYRWK